MNFNDLIAALGVIINGIPQALLALSYGFAAFPTSLGFFTGAIACLLLGSGIPISMQAETIALAGTMGRNVKERLSMVFFAGILMTVLGLTGVLSQIVELAGERIINGMMAGVGIMLTRIAVTGMGVQPGITLLSIASALVTYFLSGGNLVYTICVSVVLATIYANVAKIEIGNTIQEEKRRFKIQVPVFNFNVLRGSLALACLTIGANIAFGNITAGLGNGPMANVDHLTIYSGIADTLSSLFGGAPVEAIISATGAAPHPITSGVLMMVGMGIILLLGLLPKIGRYVPGETIYGFLFVLGAIVTVPVNAGAAFSGATGTEPLIAGVAMAVTAATDPFFGLLAGIILKFLI
ncbi:MAG: NCS2 family permease [Tissierellia bacterium]|nr:NCS2 family permease [Tissierellia bacterium]